MASLVKSAQRRIGVKLVLYLFLPTGVAILALFGFVSYTTSSQLSAVGTLRAEDVAKTARSDLQTQGTIILTATDNVLAPYRPRIADLIESGSQQASAQIGQELLEPLRRQLVARFPNVSLIMVLDQDQRILARLNPTAGIGQILGVKGGDVDWTTAGVYYSHIPASVLGSLGGDIAQRARVGDFGDAVVQFVVVPVLAPDQRNLGTLVVARMLNNNSLLSDQFRDRYSAKVSVVDASGIRVATSRLDTDDMEGVGSRIPSQFVGGLGRLAAMSGEHKSGGRDFYVAYVPLANADGPVPAAIEAAIPNSAVTGSVGTVLVVAFILLVAFIVVAAVLARSFWQREAEEPLAHFADVMRRVAEGDYSARASIAIENELDDLSTALNSMLDRISILLQTEVDRDRLQQQISELLDVVSSSAEGDLTRRADVTADVMGALADSFNMMAEELGKIIREVQSAATQVGDSTGSIASSTERMASGAEEQVLQITDMGTAIESMAVAISQVAENADAAVEAGRRTTEAALKGGEAVTKAIDAMYRIRNTVQQTADRIKTLGESSQEIGDIVRLIETIATQTNLLALNAAIEAARAGEAGRGFGVVADEVRRLADRSTRAANDIATLVQGIQAEVTEAVAAMEQGVTEVAEGVNLADEAGHALQEIVSVAQQSADLIQEISLSSRQQRDASESVVSQMESISEIAKQTATGSQQSAASATELRALADRLKKSVARFRLAE